MNTPKENSERDNAGRAAREAVSLKEHFGKRLRAYVVTAGAAGASLLAVARPAPADIIFTLVNITVEPNSNIFLDLNHDATNDFTLFHFENSLADGTMSVKGLQAGNGAVGHTTSQFGFRHAVASRLAAGARIGSGEPFRRSAILGEVLCCFSSRYDAPWVFGGDGFLGLRFEIDGQRITAGRN